jgi:hypothetical protein
MSSRPECSLKKKNRLGHIRKRLDEFEAELAKSDDPGDQFQVGYYVHHEHVRWLLDLAEGK